MNDTSNAHHRYQTMYRIYRVGVKAAAVGRAKFQNLPPICWHRIHDEAAPPNAQGISSHAGKVHLQLAQAGLRLPFANWVFD